MLYFAARKVDQSGLSTVMPRWRSGEGLCPVGVIAAYLEAHEPLLTGGGPLFPTVTRAAPKHFIIEEFAGRSWAVGLGGGGTASIPRIHGILMASNVMC